MNYRTLKVKGARARALSVIDDSEPDRKIDPFNERFINPPSPPLQVAWETASFTDDDNDDGEVGFTGQLRVVCNCPLINARCRQHGSLSIVAESLIDGCWRSIRFTSTRETGVSKIRARAARYSSDAGADDS